MKIYSNSFSTKSPTDKKFYCAPNSQIAFGIKIEEGTAGTLVVKNGNTTLTPETAGYAGYTIFKQTSPATEAQTVYDVTFTATSGSVVSTWKLTQVTTNSTVFDIDNAGILEIPIATSEVLGGIKVGANLSVAADGTLSAAGGLQEIPMASTTTLGGVRINGNNLAIDPETGILSAGGGSVPNDLSVTNLSVYDTMTFTGYTKPGIDNRTVLCGAISCDSLTCEGCITTGLGSLNIDGSLCANAALSGSLTSYNANLYGQINHQGVKFTGSSQLGETNSAYYLSGYVYLTSTYDQSTSQTHQFTLNGGLSANWLGLSGYLTCDNSLSIGGNVRLNYLNVNADYCYLSGNFRYTNMTDSTTVVDIGGNSGIGMTVEGYNSGSGSNKTYIIPDGLMFDKPSLSIYSQSLTALVQFSGTYSDSTTFSFYVLASNN